MKETTQQPFARAVDAIEAADILLTNDKADFVAGRAYYAMFYVAERCLFSVERWIKKVDHQLGAEELRPKRYD